LERSRLWSIVVDWRDDMTVPNEMDFIFAARCSALEMVVEVIGALVLARDPEGAEVLNHIRDHLSRPVKVVGEVDDPQQEAIFQENVRRYGEHFVNRLEKRREAFLAE